MLRGTKNLKMSNSPLFSPDFFSAFSALSALERTSTGSASARVPVNYGNRR
jgi:hypothetical protein